MPLKPQIQQLEVGVTTLDQRISRLEQAQSLGIPLAGLEATVPTEPLAAVEIVEPLAATEAALPPPAPRRGIRWPQIAYRQAAAKLIRGLTNTVTGWVELPKRVHETTQLSGAGAGFTWGLLRGIGYSFIRTAGGVYEAATFLFPAPPDYRPVMEPPYIFLCEAD